MAEKMLREIPRGTRDLYEKGKAALQRKNLDYALALLTQVLNDEPAFYEGREALRATQFQKAGARSGFLRKMFGTASSSSLLAKGQIALRSNPVDAVHVAESVLNNDPNNVSAHRLLAQAATRLEWPKTAVLSLEIAAKNAPQDRDIAFDLGQALSRVDNIERAENILRDLQKAHPHDQAIAQAYKNVTAQRSMKEGGYDKVEGGKGSYRDIMKNQAEAQTLEQEQRQVKTEDVAEQLIREYQQRLEHEPDNVKLLRMIADLHLQRKEFDEALEYYNTIATREGGADPSLEKAIADVSVRRFNHQIELAAQDPAQTDQVEALKKERDEYRLLAARRLVDRFPTELQARFELGKINFELGKFTEAIQEFQKAQNNPHQRTHALRYLGQCFAKKKMLDLAARTFETAIKEKPVMDEEKKELIYQLASVFETMDKPDAAVEQFKLIYEVDIGFKDVAEKVDAYYSSQ